jgi:hypothetical protein
VSSLERGDREGSGEELRGRRETEWGGERLNRVNRRGQDDTKAFNFQVENERWCDDIVTTVTRLVSLESKAVSNVRELKKFTQRKR